MNSAKSELECIQLIWCFVNVIYITACIGMMTMRESVQVLYSFMWQVAPVVDSIITSLQQVQVG